ncbi:MAG: hypothetical protein LBL45_10125 [Treponema sp.]|nr:hypothetical protein [Treponema sp.]
MNADFPAGTRIAVVNLESPSARFSDFVLEELQGYLTSGKKTCGDGAFQTGTPTERG